MTRSDFQKKPNFPWGFCIYRCSFKDNTAWHKILQLIQQRVQKSIEISMPPGEEREELLASHDLVIHDDPKFKGATSHEVRDHFHGWVAEQLPKVVDTPETLRRILESHSEKESEFPGPEYGFGARFNLALFVDDICLESLDHMRDPVVKIMYKQWGDLGPERNYEIDPEWHDGKTDEEEEDVSWMYMSVSDYVSKYDRFAWTHMALWHDEYLRPPQMLEYFSDETMQPGFWRKE